MEGCDDSRRARRRAARGERHAIRSARMAAAAQSVREPRHDDDRRPDTGEDPGGERSPTMSAMQPEERAASEPAHSRDMPDQRASDHRRLAVVITGGTRGIGAGIATAFLRAGHDVMICSRTAPSDQADTTGPGEGPVLPRTADRTATFCQADVRDPEQASRLIRAAADEFGRVDVVISNAGGSPETAAASVSPRFHQKIIELNLVAPLHVAQRSCARTVVTKPVGS